MRSRERVSITICTGECFGSGVSARAGEGSGK